VRSPLDRRHAAADRAVVEQAQVVVALALEQPVCRLDVDLAAEEVGEDAAVVPGAWYSSRPSKCSKSSFGMPRCSIFS
jgi:hypothetical protein